MKCYVTIHYRGQLVAKSTEVRVRTTSELCEGAVSAVSWLAMVL